METTLSQFKIFLDNTVREDLARKGDIPEESEVRHRFSNFYDALAPLYAPSSLHFDRESILSELVTRYCTDLAIKKRLGFEFKDEDSRPWLSAVEDQIEWFYWSRYKSHLLRDKHWSPAAVRSVDKDSHNILDLMANPREEGSFERRGLVVASVQSGKTANYIGLICRAADAGYKIIIVMAGVYNVLRNQTQARLEDGFTGFNIENQKRVFIGVGKNGASRCPIACTSREADFNKNRADALWGLQTAQTNEPLLFVIKKNSNSLKQVYEWLRDNADCDEPLLLIDDEADNASINGKYKIERRKDEPTKINGQIRNIFNRFTHGCYVGYTATPFANVLIDPTVETDEYGKDLFPSNFIYTLEESTDYFGATKVFGDYDEPKQQYLRLIEDADDILPVKHRSTFEPFVLPGSLKYAVRAFVLATAIRSIRTSGNFHSSMLINVSPYKRPQTVVAGLVRDYLQELSSAARAYGALDSVDALAASKCMRDLRGTWEKEYRDCGFGWEELQPRIYDQTLRVVCINTDSGDYLDYDHQPEHVIAVGGYRLSRGLTLEGLTVSYYSRNARAYDALMQMARWFGYRQGYEDLCRIWMTAEAAGWYKFVADSTESLFDQLRNMRQARRTPKNYVLMIRQSPEALTVTARNKMGAGKKVKAPASLNQGFIETITFDRSPGSREPNRQAFTNLLEKISAYSDFGSQEGEPYRYLFREVPRDLVVEFFETYRDEDGRNKSVLDYIDDRRIDHELETWTVLVAHGPDSAPSLELPCVGGIHLERRKPGSSSSGSVLVVGDNNRLSSRGVEAAGLSPESLELAFKKYHELHPNGNNCSDTYYRQVRMTPLLVLHPVCMSYDKAYVEKAEANGKKLPAFWQSWNYHENMFGWSVSFPHTDKLTKPVDYVLNSLTAASIASDEDESDDDYEDE